MLGNSTKQANVRVITVTTGRQAMLEESARVVSVAPDGQVWVETVRQSACGNCQSETTCGGGLQPSSRQQSQALQVDANGVVLSKGDTVVLGIDRSTVWQGLFLLYVMPLSLLAGGGAAGQWLAGEPAAAAGAVAGLLAGLWVARRLTAQQQPHKYLPIVIKRVSP